MMSGALPLLVNVGVAALARLRFHEKFTGNFLMAVNLSRAGEKVALRTIAFSVHGFGGIGGVLNAGGIQPARVAHVPCTGRKTGDREKANGISESSLRKANRIPAFSASPIGKEN